MKKIGILGGTFDPIHMGHLLIADGVRTFLKLDEVLFIPCFLPPHKSAKNLASAKHRVKMVELAIKDYPYFKISTIEIERGGKSYTIDTLKELHKLYKGKAKFYFIIGSDNLGDLKNWKSIDELKNLCQFVAVARSGYKKRYPGVKILNLPTLPISSTDIRLLIRNGKPIEYLVPSKVKRYIYKNRLYCE